MKLRKRKLFSSMAFMLSLVMLMVSGAIFVHSAQQQTATSSLSVTFSGQNVNFEAQGWYHVDGGSRTAMVNSQGGNTVSFSATETSVEKTLKISNTEAENKAVLTSEHPYVLFTYKFVNTASSGAFGMEVSLNITPTPTNLKTIKYASSTTLYTEADLDTFKDSVTGTSTFTNDFIVAGGTSGATSGNSVKYYYILLEVYDLTLPVTFNPSFNWSVRCSDSVTPPVQNYTVTINFTSIDSGSNCAAFEIWEDSSEEAYAIYAELHRPADETKKIEDLTDEISGGTIGSGGSASFTTTAEVISILLAERDDRPADIDGISVSYIGFFTPLDTYQNLYVYSVRLRIDPSNPTHSFTFTVLDL